MACVNWCMLRIAIGFVFFPVTDLAAEPPSAMTAAETKQLSEVVKQLLVKYLPDPAVTSKHNWGQQKDVTVRFETERKGPFRWQVERVKEKRNDGHWTALKLSVMNPRDNLTVELKDVRSPEPGKTTFTAILSGPVKFTFEQQLWKSGLRIYSGETRGRCEAKSVLECETTSRLDWTPGKLLPAQILRMKVTKADLSYDHLKIEHTAGLGGEAAEMIGETILAAVKRMKPSLEKDLIEKANAAVVKAGDSKEIRLELEKLLKNAK